MNIKCKRCNAKRICDYFDGQYGPGAVCSGEPIIAPQVVRSPRQLRTTHAAQNVQSRASGVRELSAEERAAGVAVLQLAGGATS
jgi:hypothetical protein